MKLGDGARGALRGAGLGLALALWSSAWIVGFLELWERGRLAMGVPVPGRLKELVAVRAEEVLANLWHVLGVSLPSDPWVFAGLLVGGAVVAGGLLGAVGGLLRVDPGAIGRGAMAYGLRGLLTWPGVAAVAVPFCVGLPLVRDTVAGPILALAALLLAVAVPFLVCRTHVVSQATPPRRWRPAWPGGAKVLWFAGIEVFVGLTEVAGTRLLGGLVATLGSLPLEVSGTLVQAHLLLTPARPSLGTLRAALRWKRFGPWLAYNLWILALPAVVAAPFAVCYLWLWKVAPAVAALADSQGMVLAPLWSFLISSVRFIGRYWWLLFPLPAAFVYWLGAGRVAYLTGGPEPSTQSARGEEES